MSEPTRIHGKTRAEWESMCLNKSRYTSDAVARAVAQWSMAQPEATTKRLFTYQCPNCRGWHLTRSSRSKSAPVTPDEIYAVR